jgi:deoxyribonuclease-4
MKYLGPHVSAQGGVQEAPHNAASLGATAFGLFVKNQRQWQAPPCSEATRQAFAASLAATGFTPRQVLPHAGYLINLANPDDAKQQRSLDAFIDELARCAALGLTALNLHPGSHLRLLEPPAALARVAAAIDTALAATSGVTVVLENTAGQGGCLGSTFEELAAIVERVADSSRIGVCLDTAHCFAAGIDLRTPQAIDDALAHFDRVVGIRYLRGLHLNDTKVALGARVDRHASLGEGQLGWAPFEHLVNAPRLDDLPLILETPDEERWAAEIRRLLDAVR